MKPHSLSALVFPRTMPRPDLIGGLAPWLRPICFLKPSGLLESGLDGRLEAAGLVESFSPGGGTAPAGPDRNELIRLLQDWELWLGQERGSGRAESLKAGLKPPPPPETVRSLMRDIASHGKPKPGEEKPPPEVTAGLLLHLAHLQEIQADEVESLIRRAESGRNQMSRVMGLLDEDSLPGDYAKVLARGLPPFDFDSDEEHLLSQKLNAWSMVAGKEAFSEHWPAASGLAAARFLMARHHRLMGREESGGRSPAGAREILSGPDQNPGPETGLAQEGLRLAVPDLGGLGPEELAGLATELEKRDEFAALGADLASLLETVASRPWGEELRGRLTETAQSLSRKMAELAPGRGALNLSLIVFPGLSAKGFCRLMQENQGKGPAPDPSRGSLPLLAVWQG